MAANAHELNLFLINLSLSALPNPYQPLTLPNLMDWRWQESSGCKPRSGVNAAPGYVRPTVTYSVYFMKVGKCIGKLLV